MPLLKTPALNKHAAAARPRSLGLAAGITGVLVLLVGWWFFWRPAWAELQSLPEIANYENTRAIAQDELASLNKMNDDFAQLSSTDRTRLDLALPSGQDLPNLLAQLEGIAKNTNFIITDISFSADRESNPAAGTGGQPAASPVAVSEAKELKINLAVQGGDYLELKKFISAVEQSLRLMQVTSVTFAAKEASSSGNLYNLNLRTVYLP